MEPILKTDKLCVIFNEGRSNEYVALKDVSIQIYPKEYIIFFGPSGTGKSTLMYSLLGLLTPASGKIYLKGRDYGAFKEKEKNERTAQAFGMVFQQYNLLFSLDVMDNVILPQIFLGRPSRERREKATNLLRRFGIEARAKQSPAMLSGGQQQRVAVCRALINDPDIILADEPVGNLDSESAHVVMETLKSINVKDQKTVILVTHDARYLPYADRVYYFKDAGIDREERISKEGGALGPGPGGAPAGGQGDLERIARTHPALSLPELKACSLSNWLVEEVTNEQRRRIEADMAKLIGGKMSPHEFYVDLDKPYPQGGVGLYAQTAASLARRVAHILGEARTFAEKSAEASKDQSKRHRLIRLMRSYLLEERQGDLTPEKLQRFGEFIDKRLDGRLNHDAFIKALTDKWKDGGIGYMPTVAQRTAERLEIIASLKG
jgi:putative ABC transport system ATP-binding protein